MNNAVISAGYWELCRKLCPCWGDSHLRALQMGAPGLWQMVTGLNAALKVQEQPEGQPVVLALVQCPAGSTGFALCRERRRKGWS